MIRILLALVVVAAWLWLVFEILGAVMGAWGLIPAIVVGWLLLAPRAQR